MSSNFGCLDLSEYNITPIKPLIFDESITFYELVCKLNKAMTDLTTYINSLENVGNSYTDGKISEVNTAIVELENELVNSINLSTNNVTKALEEKINISKTFLLSEDVKNKQELNSTITSKESQLQIDIEQNYNELYQLIVQNSLELINPTSGNPDTVQNVINSIFDIFRTGAISAQNYDNKQYTATEFDAKLISAYDYDYNATSILAAG